jgi:metal transporter CNNM
MATAPWYPPLLANVFVWISIAFCITQSAIFSGLNLAIFSISKLRLEVEAAGGNCDASALLALRKDSNLTLATVLWGNVTINVLLTLLSDSVLAGIGAFAFSTIIITLFGEIISQAYFSRNALRMVARLMPLLNVYQVGLFPIAKPTAIILNWWLGPEGITFLRERDFRALITRHACGDYADFSKARRSSSAKKPRSALSCQIKFRRSQAICRVRESSAALALMASFLRTGAQNLLVAR